MSVNLLTEIRNTLDQDITKCLAEIIDEHPEKTLDAVTAAVPALVNAMCQKATTIDGAEQVFRAVGEFDGGMVKNFRLIVESGEYQELAEAGSRLSQRISGDETDKIVDVVANYSFIQKDGAETLVKLVTPLLLAIAGDQRRIHGLNRNGVTQMLQAQQSFFALELPPETLKRLDIENPFTEAEDTVDTDMFVPKADAEFVPPIRTEHTEGVNTSCTTIIDPPDGPPSKPVDPIASAELAEERAAAPEPAETAEQAEPKSNESEAEKHARAVRDTLAEVDEPHTPDATEEATQAESTEERFSAQTQEEKTPFYQPVHELNAQENSRSKHSTEDRLEEEANDYRYLSDKDEVKIETADLVMKAILPVLAVSALWFYTHTMFGRQPNDTIQQMRPVSHQVTTQMTPKLSPTPEEPIIEINIDGLRSLTPDETIADTNAYVAVSSATIVDSEESTTNSSDYTDDANETEAANEDPFALPIVVDPPVIANTNQLPTTSAADAKSTSNGKSTLSIGKKHDIVKQAHGQTDFHASTESEAPKDYFLVGDIKVPVFATPRKTGRSYYSQSK